jgi:hypothetical protein
MLYHCRSKIRPQRNLEALMPASIIQIVKLQRSPIPYWTHLQVNFHNPYLILYAHFLSGLGVFVQVFTCHALDWWGLSVPANPCRQVSIGWSQFIFPYSSRDVLAMCLHILCTAFQLLDILQFNREDYNEAYTIGLVTVIFVRCFGTNLMFFDYY